MSMGEREDMAGAIEEVRLIREKARGLLMICEKLIDTADQIERVVLARYWTEKPKTGGNR
jgi:endonuclease III